MKRVITFSLVALALAMSVTSSHADERVIMRRDNFGQDFAFIDRYLRQTWLRHYGTEEPAASLELTPDRIWIGRYDVNGDGRDELFVFMGISCGSVGCPTALFEKQDTEWKRLFSDISVLGDGRVDGELVYFLEVWRNPDTGYKTVFSEYAGVRWTGEGYEYLGDNEVVEVSARMPPDFDTEGGCVEPGDESFAYLMAFVGTRKPMCLIYDPNVRPKLDALLGAEFLHVRKNLDRHASIGFSEGYVVIEGSRRPTDRDWDETAIVMVNTRDGRAHVSIYSEGTRTIYSNAKQWFHLPSLFRAWARGDLDPYDFDEPQDIVWIGRGEEE